VMEALRSELAAGLTSGADPQRQVRLAAVARRLAAIDPERRGVGGLRLQVELALFAAAAAGPTAGSSRPAADPGPPPAPIPVESTAERQQKVPASATESGSLSPTGAPSPTRSQVRVAPARAPATAQASATPNGAATGKAPATDKAAAADEAATKEPAAGDEAATDEAATDEPAANDIAPAVAVEAPAVAGAAAQPTTPPDDAAAAPAGSITPGTGSEALDKLRALWPEIVAHISQNPPAKPLIAACRPISVEGNIVTLGFPEGQAFLKDALERRRPMLEEGIGQFLGRAVAVRCVATNLDLVPPVAGDADAAYVLAEARRIFGEDLVDVGEVS
jgi:hypothetical protein